MQFFPVQVMQPSGTNTTPYVTSGKDGSEVGDGFGAIVERLSSAANASNSKGKNAASSQGKASGKNLAGTLGNDAKAAANSKANDYKTKIVTKEDFAALKDVLSAYGFSKAEISELEDRVNAGGLNWGTFLETLSDKAGLEAAYALRPGLDPHMRNNIESLLTKIGIMPEHAAKLVSDLEDGDVESVWNTISGALQNLSPTAAAAIDPKELQALSTALGLSPKAQEKLTAIVNGLREGKMSKAQLEDAIKVIDEDAAEMQALLDDNATDELRDRLAKVLSDVEDRGDALARSAKRTTKDVEQAKKRIERSAKEGTDGMSGVDAEDGDEDMATVAQKAARSAAESLDGSELTYMDKLRQRMMGDDATGNNGATAQANAKTDKDADADDMFNNFGDKSDDEKTWNKMFERIAEKADLHGRTDTIKAAAEDAEIAAVQSMESAKRSMTKAAEILRRANVTPDQVLDQVKNGLLKSLDAGGKELTLRLDPPDLGQMTLILQVNNKEVNATIKTESHEMTRVVAEQMSHLKASLEEQGLKVDKLEVQTELPKDTATRDEWQGEAQHNMARERETRDRMRNRLRILRSEAREMVQEMQNVKMTANISHEGLDIIA